MSSWHDRHGWESPDCETCERPAGALASAVADTFAGATEIPNASMPAVSTECHRRAIADDRAEDATLCRCKMLPNGADSLVILWALPRLAPRSSDR